MDLYFMNPMIRMVIYVKLCYLAENARQIKQIFVIAGTLGPTGVTTSCLCLGPKADPCSISAIIRNFSSITFSDIPAGRDHLFDSVQQFAQHIQDNDVNYRLTIPQAVLNFGVAEANHVHEDISLYLSELVAYLVEAEMLAVET